MICYPNDTTPSLYIPSYPFKLGPTRITGRTFGTTSYGVFAFSPFFNGFCVIDPLLLASRTPFPIHGRNNSPLSPDLKVHLAISFTFFAMSNLFNLYWRRNESHIMIMRNNSSDPPVIVKLFSNMDKIIKFKIHCLKYLSL